MGDLGRVFTTGFSRYSDRQYAVWDENTLSTPLRLENIDSSSGILTPYYDHDTRMVYVAGKVILFNDIFNILFTNEIDYLIVKIMLSSNLIFFIFNMKQEINNNILYFKSRIN